MNPNEQLESYISEFAETKDKDVFVKMMGVLENAVVFIPAIPPAEAPEEIKELAKSGKPIPITKEYQPIPCLLKKPDSDLNTIPIYTSKDKIPEDRKSPMLITMPFKGCVGMIMANGEKIHDIVVNPFTDNVTLTRQLIEIADKRFRQLAAGPKTVQLTEKQFHQFAHLRVAYEMLPKFFFAAPEKAFDELREKQEAFLVDMYQAVYPKDKISPYLEDDFSVMTLTLSDELQLTRIDLPEINLAKDLAVRIYVTLQNQKEIGYFMVKIGDRETGNTIGRIYPNGKQENLGPAPDNGAEIEMIMNFLTK